MLNNVYIFLSLSCFIYNIFSSEAEETNFNYSFPSDWKENYPTCGGQLQSPIDINSSQVERRNCPGLVLENFDEEDDETTITNDGHTVQLRLGSSYNKIVFGGPLTGRYMLQHANFHWGKTSSKGSEHQIDGKSYAMESHLVIYDTHYIHLEDALTMGGPVAVLATLYTEGSSETDALSVVTDALKEIEKNGNETTLSTIKIMDFLPKNTHTYYAYKGSLTVPPCTENITWIIFNETKTISEEQLQSFRKLLTSEDTKIEENLRPVQWSADREIRFNEEPCSAINLTPAILITVFLFVSTQYFLYIS